MRLARGRYAPSPTGYLHLGNASTALLAWLSIRAQGGRFVVRIEDLDSGRVREGLDRSILDDLAWLGLDWDEGPDLGGTHGPYGQSERGALYDRAFRALTASGRAYPCFCTRGDIAGAASAPQTPGDEVRYPGTCRGLDEHEVADRLRPGRQPAWRFRVDPDRVVHGRDPRELGTGSPLALRQRDQGDARPEGGVDVAQAAGDRTVGRDDGRLGT